jgi:hypothetical protein
MVVDAPPVSVYLGKLQCKCFYTARARDDECLRKNLGWVDVPITTAYRRTIGPAGSRGRLRSGGLTDGW